jgi:nucleoside-diphosphate-sugar epimerase
MTDWTPHHGSDFRGVKVLVTGAAGFIGSHLTEALVWLGARVVALDDLSGGDWANLRGFDAGVETITASILDTAALDRAAAGCRWVFHLAALGSVPRSIEQPDRYCQVNDLGTINVLQAARRASVQRVMFSASSSAYGDPPVDGAKVETMPTLPRSPYASTKVAGESALRAWYHSYNLDSVSLRYFNIFGPRQNANSAYAAVIAAFAKAMIAGGPGTIFGDGSQSRDFTFVANAVHANLLAARAAGPLAGQIINVATGRRVSVLHLHDQMAEIFGRPDWKPILKPVRAGDVLHSLADIDKARKLLGYCPLVDFEDGLRRTVDWYRANLPA